MVRCLMKGPPVSKSVVLRMNPNHTLSSRSMLSFSKATTTSCGCANGHSRSISCVTRTIRVWRSTRSSVSGGGWHRVRQDADQRAGHLDTDRPDDDALDPLLGGKRRLRFDSGDLPDEREDERERTDRSDQRLSDMNPGGDQNGDGRDVGTTGEKNHLRLQRVLPSRLGSK